MADIKPFTALVYNSEKVGDLKDVVAPPYDVIDSDFQNELYDRHDNNVVRLILGKTSDDDNEGQDRYSRAKSDLQSWIESNVLQRLEKPSILFYSQTFKHAKGNMVTRKGFIATARIEEFSKGSVFPHEKTLSGPKKDRLSIFKATRCNLSCIFALFDDMPDTSNDIDVTKVMADHIGNTTPFLDVDGDDGVNNKLWIIDDKQIIETVQTGMSNKALYIADGHHRYDTSLNYRNLRREETGLTDGEELFDYTMMYFNSMEDEGLVVYPTHRAVHSLEDFDSDDFLEKCEKYFEVKLIPFEDSNEEEVRKTFLAELEKDFHKMTKFGLLFKDRKVFGLLTLKDDMVMDDLVGDDMSQIYKELDVVRLHVIIMSAILGISLEDQENQTNLKYIKGTEAAIKGQNDDNINVTVLVNTTTVEEVRDVSNAGELMPQKSTYFFPKILSGLALNPMYEDK